MIYFKTLLAAIIIAMMTLVIMTTISNYKKTYTHTNAVIVMLITENKLMPGRASIIAKEKANIEIPEEELTILITHLLGLSTENDVREYIEWYSTMYGFELSPQRMELFVNYINLKRFHYIENNQRINKFTEELRTRSVNTL